MDQEKIGKFILEQRKKLNMTQSELATKLSVTSQAVSKWENGRGIPDIEIIKKLSEVFNVDVNELLEGNKIKKKANKKIVIPVTILIIVLFGIILIFALKDNYDFNSIVSDNQDFTINGVITSKEDRQSIFINDLEYQDQENKEYLYIECKLIEAQHDNLQVVDTYKTKVSSKTIDFNILLKEVEFKIGDYTSMCRNLKDYMVYIEITAHKENGKDDIYKIPLKLVDDCM